MVYQNQWIKKKKGVLKSKFIAPNNYATKNACSKPLVVYEPWLLSPSSETIVTQRVRILTLYLQPIDKLCNIHQRPKYQQQKTNQKWIKEKK